MLRGVEGFGGLGVLGFRGLGVWGFWGLGSTKDPVLSSLASQSPQDNKRTKPTNP